MNYQPNESQIGGTLLSTFLAIIITNPYLSVVVTSVIGAVVGFAVTTLLRFLFERVKKKLST